MLKKRYILLAFSAFCINYSGFTQTTDSLSIAVADEFTSIENVDYTKLQLPPVSVFLDAANNYADVKFFEARKKEQLQRLKIAKRSWLDYIRLQANYQYGTNSAYMSQSGENIPANYGYSSTNTQNWYNVGAALAIPLGDLFSKKNKTNIDKFILEQIDYEAEKTLEDRMLRILEAYNEVNKHLSILKVKAEAIALYDAQMKISENDFVNGRINIIDLSLERSRRSTAMVTFQESRAALYNAVTLLEMLTKVKIIQK
ncbi:MAG: TolC family protein [Rikenellaceae bacterium]